MFLPVFVSGVFVFVYLLEHACGFLFVAEGGAKGRLTEIGVGVPLHEDRFAIFANGKIPCGDVEVREVEMESFGSIYNLRVGWDRVAL